MKVHYINILLFALPLNILANTHKKAQTAPHHTQTNRSLCECELYAPANYDNDPQMKKVMDNFNKQTQQRFHEYEERMIKNRQNCKEKCDKDIQKIILKDKLEKQMAQQLDTLETKITTDDIPTCVCEKSLADKVEKGCLRCGGVFGGGVAPSVGILGGIGEAAISAWQTAALKVAIEEATAKGAAEGLAAGLKAGKELVIEVLKSYGVDSLCPKAFEFISNIKHYSEVANFAELIFTEKKQVCAVTSDLSVDATCKKFNVGFGITKADGSALGAPDASPIRNVLEQVVDKATTNYNYFKNITSERVTTAITNEKTSEIAATYASWETTIIAAVVAIVVIVSIMVIIYLILRYRRKKKMKKKFQYIKLLEE
ncbi:rifin [Plasmodium reichenowi]|uniref:Rifin n=1 Tax=Plasmodium reichenowi TaxID=5854 RepID=A0A060RLV2_PLARE|nr:rifin [Plasmodium reichenowi]